MLDSHSIITHVTHGIVKELADEYECSLQRAYEMLGNQCVYPKAKKLIRTIARLNPEGARMIKADMDSMFADILTPIEEPTLEDLHKEAFEAVDSVLRNRPAAEQKLQVMELLEICQRKLAGLERREQLKAV